MQLGLILMVLSLGEPGPRVISEQHFGLQSWRATSAKLIQRPIGVHDESFAQALVDASGIKPWNGQVDSSRPSSTRMGVKAVTSGSGPEVTVFFGQGDQRKAGRVCQITREHGGLTEEWISAYDWCASRLGKSAFNRRPPIITSTEVPPMQPR
ncbi:hypothetical protein M8312_13270 [Sphingomonas sp. KRR8]|uniref:hypothetical protein n=1 Tax=Sphingomonas sp. KRR8 TaxID=2942996 RepID=UPI002020E069|nr:hypothetical protein [Sphingomonas sp. KRR8]URD60729.1 hypothetical protein M8312_13270 [Sphingomonas sp. KRR8]